jgi:integrase
MDALRRDAAYGVAPDRARTIASLPEFWLDEVVAGTIDPETWREYRKRVRRIVPHIGHIKLAKLNATHVQSLANALARQYPRSAGTRGNTMSTLRRALHWAVGAQLIPRNPAEHIGGVRTPAATIDDTLTADEAKAVLLSSRLDNELGALWWLALTYGLRLGELLDLRRADVSADEITVRRAKTRAGRTLPLTAEAKRVLLEHRNAQRVAHLASIEGYVFPSSVGTKLTDKRTREKWNALLRQAGVKHMCRNCGSDDRCSSSVRRFHVSRHTAATLLLEAGVPLEVVLASLGHSNIGVTADTYTKIRSDLMRKGLAKLDG